MKTEVDQYGTAVRGDDDIPRVNIEMENRLVVEINQRIEKIEDRREEALRRGVLRWRTSRERLAFDVFSRVVGKAVVGVTEVVGGRDPRMRQRGDGTELALQARDRTRGDTLGVDHSERNVALAAGVVCQVNGADASRAESPF